MPGTFTIVPMFVQTIVRWCILCRQTHFVQVLWFWRAARTHHTPAPSTVDTSHCVFSHMWTLFIVHCGQLNKARVSVPWCNEVKLHQSLHQYHPHLQLRPCCTENFGREYGHGLLYVQVLQKSDQWYLDWNMAKQRFFIWSIWFWLGFAGTKYQLLCFGSWLEFAKWELNGGIELAIWS